MDINEPVSKVIYVQVMALEAEIEALRAEVAALQESSCNKGWGRLAWGNFSWVGSVVGWGRLAWGKLTWRGGAP